MSGYTLSPAITPAGYAGFSTSSLSSPVGVLSTPAYAYSGSMDANTPKVSETTQFSSQYFSQGQPAFSSQKFVAPFTTQSTFAGSYPAQSFGSFPAQSYTSGFSAQNFTNFPAQSFATAFPAQTLPVQSFATKTIPTVTGASLRGMRGYFGGKTLTQFQGLQQGANRGVIVGEEIINIPVRVPIYQQQVQVVRAIEQPQVQYVDRYVPQVQFVEKIVEKVVEKVVDNSVLVRVYSCNGCGQDIDGEAIETKNGRFHQQCFVVCAGCGGWIQFEAFEAMGLKWHRECFVCGVCFKECASGYIIHEGRQVHSLCVRPIQKTSVSGGMAAKRSIKAKTFEEAVRYDEMGGGAPDGKYNGILIECDDPRWKARAHEKGYDTSATWECSDAAMASRYTTEGGKVVVSTDGSVDGNV